MKWHRKHPKKNVATKTDIQLLLNEFKAAIQEMGSQQPGIRYANPVPEKEAVALYNAEHPDQHLEISYVPERTYEEYRQAKRECENDYDWLKLKGEILASSLPKDQKDILIKIN